MADGTPYITVIADGGWSKRSYGHGYNAASGVVSIFIMWIISLLESELKVVSTQNSKACKLSLAKC